MVFFAFLKLHGELVDVSFDTVCASFDLKDLALVLRHELVYVDGLFESEFRFGVDCAIFLLAINAEDEDIRGLLNELLAKEDILRRALIRELVEEHV